jgi:5-methylcytosine-specific restriction endonuclease McrA
MMDTKFCTKCGVEKPETLEFFSKQTKGRNGLRAYCRVCLSRIGKEYYKSKKDHHKKVAKVYRENNKDRRNILLQKYLTEKQNLPSTLTLSQWESTKEYFNHQCAYCGEIVDTLEQDHVIPLSKGGGHTKGNILPVCKPCNNSKFTKEFKSWYILQPFFLIKRYNKILSFMKKHHSIYDYTSKVKGGTHESITHI